MISCIAGSLFAILSYLLLIEVTRAVHFSIFVSPGPLLLGSPTRTFEFEVLINNFTNESLHLAVFRNRSGGLLYYVNLYWSDPVSSSQPVQRELKNRWNYIKLVDSRMTKNYAIRLSNVTAKDAGLYLCSVGPELLLDGAEPKTSKVWLFMNGILIF